jgi:hypothetical protein
MDTTTLIFVIIGAATMACLLGKLIAYLDNPRRRGGDRT